MITTYRWADHRLFPRPEGALLFGVDEASLFAVDEEARDILARWRTRDPLLLDEVPAAERGLLEDLREARLLVPAQSRRAPVPSLPDPGGIPLGTLVLEVAQACNLRCGYCYAAGGAYGGEAKLLDPGAARRAARRLVEGSGDREEVTLILFGGEPLLNTPAVKAAVEEARACAAREGKRLTLSLTTNGTLLDDEVVAFLRANRVCVSVSLDGPPDVHDVNRPFAGDGGGSYAQVLRGLQTLLRAGPQPVAARVTLQPKQWGRVPEVFDHLLGLGFHEVGIAPASPVTPDLLPSDEEEEALFEGFAALARRFEVDAREGRILPFSNLLDLLGRLHGGTVKSAPCGAGLGYLAMDASERLYLCHRLVGEAEFEVGNLEAGPDPARVRACLEGLAAPRKDACSLCWVRALCRGGCHYENYVRESALGQAPGGSCRFIRRWISLGVELYGRLEDIGTRQILAHLDRRAAH
ncbi:MAG: radical SAM protein [Deferrisomatales bacterium]